MFSFFLIAYYDHSTSTISVKDLPGVASKRRRGLQLLQKLAPFQLSLLLFLRELCQDDALLEASKSANIICKVY